MSHQDLCCGMYRGEIYARNLAVANSPLLPIGNAEATINQSMTETSIPDYRGLSGKACSINITESMTVDLVLHCTNPENLALAFIGDVSVLNSNTVVNEEHTVRAKGSLIVLDNVANQSSIVVKDDLETTTFTLGEDYKIVSAGIVILEEGDIAVNDVLKISYSHGKNIKLNAQTTGQKTLQLVMALNNYGDEGVVPVKLDMYKVKFSPTDTFTLIGSDFASINITGEILKDDTKPTGSQFFDIEYGIADQGIY